MLPHTSATAKANKANTMPGANSKCQSKKLELNWPKKWLFLTAMKKINAYLWGKFGVKSHKGPNFLK